MRGSGPNGGATFNLLGPLTLLECKILPLSNITWYIFLKRKSQITCYITTFGMWPLRYIIFTLILSKFLVFLWLFYTILYYLSTLTYLTTQFNYLNICGPYMQVMCLKNLSHLYSKYLWIDGVLLNRSVAIYSLHSFM